MSMISDIRNYLVREKGKISQCQREENEEELPFFRRLSSSGRNLCAILNHRDHSRKGCEMATSQQ